MSPYIRRRLRFARFRPDLLSGRRGLLGSLSAPSVAPFPRYPLGGSLGARTLRRSILKNGWVLAPRISGRRSCPPSPNPARRPVEGFGGQIPATTGAWESGGEGGIRTLEAGFSHLRDFQSRSFGQLGHLSAFRTCRYGFPILWSSIMPAFAQPRAQTGGGLRWADSRNNRRVGIWRRGRDSNPRYGFTRTTA